MTKGKKVSDSAVKTTTRKAPSAGKASKRTPAKPATKAATIEPTAMKPAAKPSAARAPAVSGAKSKPVARSRAKPPAPANDVDSPAKPASGSAFDHDIAKLAARPPHSPVRIFQIYFEPWHRDLLDPAFAPYDNSGGKTELLEFEVFEKLAKSKLTEGAELWGALSWRFLEKTGLSGAELIGAIEANPGKDVYYCNPHTHNEALYHNMWQQGETSHPRFLEVVRAVFAAAGLPAEELGAIEPARNFSSANYFVGSPRFWSLYLPFVRKVLAQAEKKLPREMREMLHSTEADDRGLHGGSTYVPFIVERLFPLFMRSAGVKLQGHKIALPKREAELNVHLKLLRDMKDVAHRTKSPWLAACWVNYRNLYLTQFHGKQWSQKYLRAVTPTQVRFA